MPELNVPKTKFVLPTAKSRPISLNNGYPMPGWSDILGLDISSPEDKTGFEESRSRVNALVEKEIAAGIPASKIVIAGFSQGGALALHTVRKNANKCCYLSRCILASSCCCLNMLLPIVTRH